LQEAASVPIALKMLIFVSTESLTDRKSNHSIPCCTCVCIDKRLSLHVCQIGCMLTNVFYVWHQRSPVYLSICRLERKQQH